MPSPQPSPNSEKREVSPESEGHQAPKQIKPRRLGDYLEIMSKSVFQTGISWQVVNNKWPGICEAFDGFDAARVASFTEKRISELTQDARVIRNRRKIEAIVENARRLIELEEQHGGFRNYLRSHSDFEALVKDLRKQFKFLGDTGSYVFLYVVGEPVPPHEQWMASRQPRKPPRAVAR
jgi:3-methyladenine DNA glycosylase Tag